MNARLPWPHAALTLLLTVLSATVSARDDAKPAVAASAAASAVAAAPVAPSPAPSAASVAAAVASAYTMASAPASAAAGPGAPMAPGMTAAAQATRARTWTSTTDHSKLAALQGPFASGPDVTKACLACHSEAAKQVHKTKHWTWEFINPSNQQVLGKKHVINNFCTAVPSNEKFCSSCHAGYGWQDANFDFKSEANVDCLVCHETTGKYKKLPGLAGHPPYQAIEFPPGSGKTVPPVDLVKVAQSVGPTSRQTCGACHFYGGGGDAVKHGDLDSSMTNPPRYLDVHMDAKGLNFSCATCHATKGHNIPGSRYTPTGRDGGKAHIRGQIDDSNPATCQSCHGPTPHPEARLNAHADKLACQTCHVPLFARGNIPTKMTWDWSTAGKLTPEGKPMVLKASNGQARYDSKKGDFTYDSHVVPEYRWINGDVKYTLLGDPIDPTQVTRINTYGGSPTDGKSRIWPVKVFRGKQPYDLESKSLLVPHTAVGYGEHDDTSYWQNFKWDAALKAGSDAAGQPFGGKFAFAETEMTWPITHMVAPKGDALTCTQCHAKGGRLDGVAGLYMPRRDSGTWIDQLGWLLVGATFLGVLGHGLMRLVTRRRSPHHG